MIDDDFKYEVLTSVGGKTFMRISMDYEGETFYEDIKIYWFGLIWHDTSAKIKILRRILKHRVYIENKKL